ncbi:MAG: hypothetical protein AUI11_09270 [Acidobacteria bacterium 13_2_20CM_2_66_4]|nr:MAG: hypothetical protein AUI11_09270 [Acidobacteria bacterium 13_2_20CM_2_66_4]
MKPFVSTSMWPVVWISKIPRTFTSGSVGSGSSVASKGLPASGSTVRMMMSPPAVIPRRTRSPFVSSWRKS